MRGAERAQALKDEYQVWRKKMRTEKVPFFMVFQPILESLKQIKPGALKMYLFLGLRAKNDTGEVFWGETRMAEELGVDERTVRSWLKELQDRRLIERIRLRAGGTVHTFLLPMDGTTKPVSRTRTESPQLKTDGAPAK